MSTRDPYAWLEPDDDDALAWQWQQDAQTRESLESWPGREALHRLVESLDVEQSAPPIPGGGRWFTSTRQAGGIGVLVADSPSAPARLLVDPEALAEKLDGGPVDLGWLSISPRGSLAAVGASTNGREDKTLFLVDVATGKWLDDRVDDVPSGELAWLPDESGFWFTGGRTAAGDPLNLDVRFHRIGAPPPAIDEREAVDVGDSAWAAPLLSSDAHWLAVLADVYRPRPFALRDLHEVNGPWRPFLREAEGSWSGALVGNRYVALTTCEAPLGRIVAVPLATPEDRSTWRELVPQGSAVLQELHVVGGNLLVRELHEARPQLRVLDLEGRELRVIPAPPGGRVSVAAADAVAGVATITTEACDTSPACWAYDVRSAELTELVAPARHLPGIEVRRICARSADGTMVSAEVIGLAHSADHPPGAPGPRPTLIHAYGGFGQPHLPQWAPHQAAFVLAGGVLVVPHLRGGGEYGDPWWHGGRLEHKQQTFDDLFAVAEHLVAEGIADPQRLALWGASNGGLTAGVAIVQRPELWRAVVAYVPILDLIRGAELDPVTAYATGNEYGDPRSSPEEAARLRTFSPQHNVVPGTAYPAVLLWPGAEDIRARPWQSRKFAAALQDATSSGHPVHLRVQRGMGHVGGADPIAMREAAADWIAFVMRELGMEPAAHM